MSFFLNTEEQRDLGWQFSGSIDSETIIKFIVSDSLNINDGWVGAFISDDFRLPWNTENAMEDSVIVSSQASSHPSGSRISVTVEKGKGMVRFKRGFSTNRMRTDLEITLVEDGE